jgi:adenine-specific DNA methylase
MGANAVQQSFSLVIPTRAASDKLRGGYYTPDIVARWLCSWAVRSRSDRILEPSCGDGNFLVAAASRLLDLGCAATDVVGQITGIEVAETEAEEANRRLNKVLGARAKSAVFCKDFFTWMNDASPLYDCVVGNPPFIRYQNFPEPSRSRAMRLMSNEGLRPNKLTNSWVPFLVGAVSRLATGGRVAMVLPAELLQVSYAAQLRSYLAAC